MIDKGAMAFLYSLAKAILQSTISKNGIGPVEAGIGLRDIP